MIDRLFHLKEHNSTVKGELVGGMTTFLSVMYIMFVNSTILSASGMPFQGVFVATALTSAVCTLFAAIYANLPFAMAPGMGMNSVFVNTICLGMGYHWKEALAITFISGLFHVFIMLSPLRKALYVAIPLHLKNAASAGLGMFISYAAIKNTGLLSYSVPADSYIHRVDGSIIADSSTIPGITRIFGYSQLIAIISLVSLLVLIGMQKRTGEKFWALPMSILVGTFVGIPMNISNMRLDAGLTSMVFSEYREVFFSFFDVPGITSIFGDFGTIVKTISIIMVLSMTNIMDSVASISGIGGIEEVTLFDDRQHELLESKWAKSKIDRALIVNSVGGVTAPLFGSSTAITYLESITGMISGGRTGLAGIIVSLLFLLCLPLAGFFHIIPIEAVAPAMIFAGGTMITRLRKINWSDISESFPAFITMLMMPITYNILDGMIVGLMCYIVIELFAAREKKIHPLLYIISLIYIATKVLEFVF